MAKKKTLIFSICLLAFCLIWAALYFLVRSYFPQPYRETVQKSGVDPFLVYAVMKAESGFDEEAKSRAGAVGIMQIMPSTAEFVCRLDGIEFEADRLYEGDYNTALGCRYLVYLLEKFTDTETALCAYNAGEGTVTAWINDPEFSEDGKTLKAIPFPETRSYVKKIAKLRKIYEFFY